MSDDCRGTIVKSAIGAVYLVVVRIGDRLRMVEDCSRYLPDGGCVMRTAHVRDLLYVAKKN